MATTPEADSVAASSVGRVPLLDRYRLLQAGLIGLRAGPALILLILIVVIGLTTPVFLTSRNIGNVFSQTSVIAVLALGQLLVILTRGIDLSVGSAWPSRAWSARASRARPADGARAVRARRPRGRASPTARCSSTGA